VSARHAVALVARREFRERVRGRGFRASTAVMILAVLGIMAVSAATSPGRAQEVSVAVSGARATTVAEIATSNSTTPCCGRMPATTRIVPAHTPMTAADPRSFCNSTSPIGMPARMTATASRHASRSPRCWWQYPAIAMITATFATSDGWNWSGPTWNHACAPLRLAPISNTPASNGSTET